MGGAVSDEGQGIRQNLGKLYVWLHTGWVLTITSFMLLGMNVVILFVEKVDYRSVMMLGSLLIAGAGCVIILLSLNKLRNLLFNREIKPTGRGMEN